MYTLYASYMIAIQNTNKIENTSNNSNSNKFNVMSGIKILQTLQ